MKTTSSDTSKLLKSGPVWLLVLFTLVMALMLLAVLFGAYVYQLALDTDAQDTQLRSVEGFLTSTFRSVDTDGAVEIEQGPEGDVLCVYADADKYDVTYIYKYDGHLVAEYTVTGELQPDNAMQIAEVGSFDASCKDDTVRVSTDTGDVVCTLRSEARDDV